MHLRDYPQYFVKGDKRRAVYYTVDASALLALGWKREEGIQEEPLKEAEAKTKIVPVAEPGPEPEKIEIEIVEEKQPEIAIQEPSKELPDFEFMTKNELIKFAAEHGETLSVASLKSDLVDACKKLVRARDGRGRFLGDDPSTPDVNEAWTIG